MMNNIPHSIMPHPVTAFLILAIALNLGSLFFSLIFGGFSCLKEK